MSPCVYHMSSLTKAVTLPVPDNVITQAMLFEGDRVSDLTVVLLVPHNRKCWWPL